MKRDVYVLRRILSRIAVVHYAGRRVRVGSCVSPPKHLALELLGEGGGGKSHSLRRACEARERGNVRLCEFDSRKGARSPLAVRRRAAKRTA